ncbi:hypothetical protein [Deinococcus aquaticus]|uniref:MarR family transcriptional regulator n=1 Tax=Deinococcus aquaticus TaxID=328692 RepID=A0ABY7V7R3_9DEIO|nr:hypothetical protein [Deinococcus aquaticus]WDA60744.1 hypothetical protein M8445_17400 [Deinococcus aquaticus]
MSAVTHRAGRIAELLSQHPGRAYTANELSAALQDLTPNQCRVAADQLVEEGHAARRLSTRAEVRRRSSEYLQEVPA